MSSFVAPAQQLLKTDNDLWQFALSFYCGDGTAPACLVLQEGLGADVNILIFAIFAASQGVVLSDADLAEVDHLVTDWRSEIVQALRQLRTALKVGPAPAPSPATDALRNRIKAIELEAEQIELAVLDAWLAPRPRSAADPSRAEGMPARVARYFGRDVVESRSALLEQPLRTLSLAARKAAENAADRSRS